MKQKMSERSAIWLKKRSFLDHREERVKNELSEASHTLETGVKKILMSTAAVGASLTVGYIIYKAFSKPKKKPRVETIEVSNKPDIIKMKTRSRFSLKNLIVERIALALVQFIGAQIAILLSKSEKNKV